VKLIAGLGNPGDRYRGTRHNVGFDVLDLVARRHGLTFEVGPVEALQARWRRGDGVVLLCKGLGYMNESGRPVSGMARYYRIPPQEILVVCDDVNLPLGRLRVRTSGSEGGHNGLKSIAAALDTTEYARLRIGVGRGDLRRDLADHVLARFEPDERPGIEGAIARAADAVETWVDHGAGEAMNIYNRAEA
jgi:PTH1 family peptidyl-tRNA hydrolase